MSEAILEIRERAESTAEPHTELVLPFDMRQKSRFRATLSDGRDVAIQLERGQMLRDGDKLKSADGAVVRVRAANETVSVGRTSDPLLHAKAAYHLGNRHVPLQIQAGEVIYQHDHVLDDMLRNLGLGLEVEERPFEPESGAYGKGHAHHSRGKGGGHSHDHGGHHHHH